MGGDSSKLNIFGGRKKEEPARGNPWKSHKWAVFEKKTPRKKSTGLLDKLNLDNLKEEGPGEKRFSLGGDKKTALSIKNLSLKIPGKKSGKKTKKRKKEKKKKVGGVFENVLNYSPPRERVSKIKIFT